MEDRKEGGGGGGLVPGCRANKQNCKRLVISLSSGACSTMVTEPLMHSTHPRMPNRLSRSFSMACASTALQHKPGLAFWPPQKSAFCSVAQVMRYCGRALNPGPITQDLDRMW